jgi:hypothetical protein
MSPVQHLDGMYMVYMRARAVRFMIMHEVMLYLQAPGE